MDSLKDLIAITQKDNPRFVSLLYLDAMMKSPIQSRNPRISEQGHPEETDADKTHTDRQGYYTMPIGGLNVFKGMHDDIMAWRKARKRHVNHEAGHAVQRQERARAFVERTSDRIEHSLIDKVKSGNYSRGWPTALGSTTDTPVYTNEHWVDVIARNWADRTARQQLVEQLRAMHGESIQTKNEFSFDPLTQRQLQKHYFAAANPVHSTSTPNPKENTMSTDASILVKLAQADTQDEFTENLSSMPPQLREALEEQRKQESKETYTAAAKLILRLYKDAEERTAYQVETIRKAREAEKVAKDKIAKIKRAKAYAEETNNYLPLALLTIGLNHSEHIAGDKLFVPLDWVEPVVEKPEAVAPKKAPAKK